MNIFRIKDIFTNEVKDGGNFHSGQKIKDIKRENDLSEENIISYVNGVIVGEEFELAEKDELLIVLVPRGGSARKTLFGILAMGIGGLAAQAFGLKIGSYGYGLVQSLVSSALSKKWVSPPQLSYNNSSSDDKTFHINSQNNEYRFNQKVPVVLGEVKYAPPKAALDYAEISGNDYYYNMLFCCGYGDLDISDVKIGETPIDTFDGVTQNIVGKKDDITKFAYFNKDVYEESFSDFEITDSWEDEEGNLKYKVTQENTDQISVDLMLPEGLVRFDNNNNKVAVSVDIEIEYGEFNDETQTVSSWKTFNNSINFSLTPEDSVKDIDAIVTEYESNNFAFFKDNENPNFGWIYNGNDPSLYRPPFVNGDVINISGTTLNNGEATVIDNKKQVPNYYRNNNGIYIQKENFKNENVSEAGKIISWIYGKLTKTVSIDPYIRITDAYAATVRKNIRFTTSHNSKWAVRIKRRTPASADINTRDKLQWSVLRSINLDKNSDLVPDGLSYIELRLKATGQLSGAVDSLTCKVKSVLPVWSGSIWSEVPSNNPAWCALHVLRGDANRQPAADDTIDLDSFKAWADWCDTNDYTFNAIISSQMAMNDLLHDISSAGRASIFIKEGKWTVVQDIPQEIPKYLITTRNIIKDSYSFSKTFKKNVECLKIKFANSDNKEDLYPICIDTYGIPGMPGYDSATDINPPEEIEEMTVKGVTNPDQIYKLGRYWLNCERLRPFIHSWEMDIEHYNLSKGDRILFSHDVLRFDLSRGRIKSLLTDGDGYVEGIVVDEECIILDSENYMISFMNFDKTIKEQIVVDNAETKARLELELGHQITDSFINTKTIMFSSSQIVNPPEVGNYFVFGKVKVNSFLITDVEPTGNDKKAKITAVDYNEDVYSESFPEFSTTITVQDKVLKQIPPVPEIESIVSDESVLVKKGNALISRIAISLKQSSDSGIQPESYQAQYRLVGSTVWESVSAINANDRIVYISDVEDGSQYELRLRSLYEFRSSDWTSPVTHTVVGKTTPPANISNFEVGIEGVNFNFSFDKLSILDISAYEIRLKNTDWDDSEVYVTTDTNKLSVKNILSGAGIKTFLIKAVDVVGNYSDTAREASVDIPLPSDVTVFNISISGENLVMKWSDVPEKYIDYYEIREKNTEWNDSEIFVRIKSNEVLMKSNIQGTGIRTFLIKAKDIRGNYSEIEAEASINILAPLTPVLKPSVEKNRVYIDWQDCKTSFPIKTYKLRKDGTNWDTANIINDFIGSITIYPTSESESKIYTYRLKAVDTAGNESNIGTVNIPVGESFDFQLYTINEQIDFSGAILSNAKSLSNTGVILPVNTSETWEEHFLNNGWSSPQDQIDAGYPIYIQPTVENGYVEYSFDMGDSVLKGQIETYIDAEMNGSVSTITKTSVSNDNVTWTEYDSDKVYTEEEFRYIKIRLSAIAIKDTDLIYVSKITTVIKLEVKEELGSATVTSYNQSVSLNVDFNQIDNISVSQADNSIPVIVAIADYGTANPTSFKVRIWDIAGYQIEEAGYTGPNSIKIDYRIKGK